MDSNQLIIGSFSLFELTFLLTLSLPLENKTKLNTRNPLLSFSDGVSKPKELNHDFFSHHLGGHLLLLPLLSFGFS